MHTRTHPCPTWVSSWRAQMWICEGMVQRGPVEFVGAEGALCPTQKVSCSFVGQNVFNEPSTEHPVGASANDLDLVGRLRTPNVRFPPLDHGVIAHYVLELETTSDDLVAGHSLDVVCTFVDLQYFHHLVHRANGKRLSR